MFRKRWEEIYLSLTIRHLGIQLAPSFPVVASLNDLSSKEQTVSFWHWPPYGTAGFAGPWPIHSIFQIWPPLKQAAALLHSPEWRGKKGGMKEWAKLRPPSRLPGLGGSSDQCLEAGSPWSWIGGGAGGCPWWKGPIQPEQSSREGRHCAHS